MTCNLCIHKMVRRYPWELEEAARKPVEIISGNKGNFDVFMSTIKTALAENCTFYKAIGKP